MVSAGGHESALSQQEIPNRDQKRGVCCAVHVVPGIDTDVGAVVCCVNNCLSEVVGHQPTSDNSKGDRWHDFRVRSDAGDANAIIGACRHNRCDVVAMSDSHLVGSTQNIGVVFYEIVAITIVHKPVEVVVYPIATDLATILPDAILKFRAANVNPAVNDLYHFSRVPLHRPCFLHVNVR